MLSKMILGVSNLISNKPIIRLKNLILLIGITINILPIEYDILWKGKKLIRTLY